MYCISGARGKKIIPVLIENCQVPELLRYICLCNYVKEEVRAWFWPRLISSIKAPVDGGLQGANKQRLNSITLDTSMKIWSDSSSSSSMSSTMSSMPSMSSSSSSANSSMSSTDYTPVRHDYLDLPPASPKSQRKFNEYQKMTNVQQPRSQTERLSSPRSDKDKPSNKTAPVYPSSRSPIPPPRSSQASHSTSRAGFPPPLPPRETSKKKNKKSEKSNCNEAFV